MKIQIRLILFSPLFLSRSLILFLALSIFYGQIPESYGEKIVPNSQIELQLSFAPLVKTTAHAVVNIYAKKIVTERVALFSNPFFRHFFNDNFSGTLRKRITNSLGSGVILRENGLIVTNAHVIDGAEEIIVVLADHREYEAKLLLKDEHTDLAILQIKTKTPLPFLQFGDSDEIDVGDLVIAIGNPFSVGQTVTSGIISAVARAPAGISDYRSFIQTDAAINPGNSGGALINMQGKLIGINTAIFSKTGESLGIGFAVPANMVKLVADHAASGRTLLRPWTGLAGVEIDWDIAQSLQQQYPGGMLVSDIYPNSPAAKAGIQTRDVITHIDDYKFATLQDFRFRLALKTNDKQAIFIGNRAGKAKKWYIKLEPPIEIPKRERTKITGNTVLTGAILENLSPKIATEIGFDIFSKGVIIRDIQPDSPAVHYRFQPNDIIRKINQTTINKTKDIIIALKQNVNYYEIVIERNNDNIKMTFR